MENLKFNLEELQKIAKERTVKTQNVEYDLDTLKKRIDNNTMKLDPEYQRNHRWNNETSSKLIESLILNIPIPTVYLSLDVDVDDEIEENEVARYSVIDGQQRLTAIHKFMSNELVLSDLKLLEKLNGCKYSELPPFLIRRLDDRTVKCLRIDSTLDSQVKYDIFERLNSGSVQLNSQELRNAIYRGPFNNLIKELAQYEKYKSLIHIDKNREKGKTEPKIQKMEDTEYILRFFSFDDYNYREITKLKEFLSSQMEKLNKKSSEELENMRKNFIKVIDKIYDNFGDSAFAKYKFINGDFKVTSRFNTSVYDALMVSVSINLRENILNLEKKNIDNFKNLFKEDEFQSMISGGTVDRKKVESRIDLVREILK